jgi:fatty-acyl-CoA synthase
MRNNLFDRLQAHAAHGPDKTAWSFFTARQRCHVSYAQLLGDVVACMQSPRCPAPGELLFISSAIDYPCMVLYLAAVFQQAVPAFLSPLTPRQDPNIHASEMQALLARFYPNRLVDASGDHFYHSRQNPLCLGHSGFLQFSSGTTSLKKGVLITEAMLGGQLNALGRALAITPADKIVSWLPLYHDMGLITSLFLPLYVGCSVAFLDAVEWSFKPDALFKAIEDEQGTLCWQPDFAFGHLCKFYAQNDQAPRYNLSSVRQFISCSEPCKTSTFRQFLNTFETFGLQPDSLQTCYAMAETVFAVSHSRFSRIPRESGHGDLLPSGQVIDGCEVRIVPVDGEALGEIHVKSDYLFGGYFAQPAPTLGVDGWYNTGDLGALEGGQLFVAGRNDDVLIVNGKKIVAHQIETYLGQLPGFKSGRVFCTLSTSGTALAALHEGDEVLACTLKMAKKWVTTSSGVTLDEVVHLPPGTLVKSSSGKIARKKTLSKLDQLHIWPRRQQPPESTLKHP